MEKSIFLIACFIVTGYVAEEVGTKSNNLNYNAEMAVLVENVSELTSKVLEIFEPMAVKASSDSKDENDNTYFVSFLLRDRGNKTMKKEDGTMMKQRMVVNNNFSGEKMGASQVYVESGQPPKQPPMHNIQLLNNNPQNPSYQQPYQQQNPQRYG